MKNNIIPVAMITEKIFEIRDQRVMIDADLASFYEVPTKALNQAVKRNLIRFPEDFMFKLNAAEKNELVTKCDQFTKLKHSTSLPHAFTECGVAMLSSVLNSERASIINIQIMRAFVRLRKMLTDHEALRLTIEGLEKRVGKNERDIQIAIKAIQSILTPTEPPKKKIKIGFCPPDKGK